MTAQGSHDAPLVGVVVPVRNRRDKTLRFLDRFHRQSYGNVRLYLVDSNSTDGTPEAIRAAWPDAVVLAATDRDYWAGATNIGVRRALADGADYILTINDDGIVLEDFLETLVGVAESYGAAILGTRIDHMDRPGLVWSIGASHHWGTSQLFCTNYGGVREEDLPPLVRDAEILPVESMPGNGVLIHRDVFARIGLYDARFTPHYHADTEFMLRARRRGLVPMVTPRAVVYNDFALPEPRRLGVAGSLGTALCSLARARSHWYLPPHLAILVRYCPPALWLPSLLRYLAQVYRFAFANAGIRQRLYEGVRDGLKTRAPGLWRRLRGLALRAKALRRPASRP